jgi:hypothetical protein
MSKLSDAQFREMIKLAITRVEAAFQSVDQLVEDPQQSHTLQIAVIAALVDAAAEFLHDNALMGSGDGPPKEVAFYKVLMILAKFGNMDALKRFMREEKIT